MPRPEWCSDDLDDTKDDPCPLCGATPSGKDPVRGVCQAWHNRPRPRPLVELILVRRDTGERV